MIVQRPSSFSNRNISVNLRPVSYTHLCELHIDGGYALSLTQGACDEPWAVDLAVEVLLKLCPISLSARGKGRKYQRCVVCQRHQCTWLRDECSIGKSRHRLKRVLDYTDPVSYTHLDVYKRQMYAPLRAAQSSNALRRSRDMVAPVGN